MQWLKQSTSVTLKIGPFIDETDGKTAETALTIAQADVRLSMNGGNITQKTESTACTHDELGVYGCPVDTTDTGTLGRLQLWVHESGALPVWHEYMVVPANVWDSMFGADYLQVDAIQISGDATAANNCELMFDGTGYAGGTTKLGVDAVAISGDTTAADNCEAMYDGTGYVGGTIKLGVDAVKISGDATAADNCELFFDGTGYAGGSTPLDVNTTTIEGSDATDQINAAVDAALDTAIPGSPTAHSINERVKAIDALTEGSGSGDLAAILADTNELQGDLTNTGRLDTILDAIKAKTDNLPVTTKKNVALANFGFLMVDSTDHLTAKTGLTVTAQISKDGGSFAGVTPGTVAEIGSGCYKVSLSQTEMNADVIILKFTATGADQTTFTILTDT